MKKVDFKKLIDEFIYDELTEDEYKVFSVYSNELLTWNRLDFAFKLFYLDHKMINTELAKTVYKADIKAQTLGKYLELGQEVSKNSFQKYLNDFETVFENIKTNGFDEKETIIPLSKYRTAINGAHRVSSAINLKQQVVCMLTESEDMVADYKYFYERAVPEKIIETVVKKFIEYSNDNTYIAFLWPSGKGSKQEAESKFRNIVYRKEIQLTPNGSFNLLLELYKHMDWVGSDVGGFKGIRKKLVECFPDFNSFTVIVFQESSLANVRDIKEEVREIYNIGYSSVHITDTKEEAIRISNLILNDNGIHFLNYSNPYKYKNIFSKLDEFKKFLEKNHVDNREVIIDGSLILTLYGLRINEDVDYLVLDNSKIKYLDCKFENHDSELIYHKKNKADLIYDEANYFYFYGLKFISFQQLFFMKQNRAENKDLTDRDLMSSLIENNKYKKVKSQIKQNVFYLKIKLSNSIMTHVLFWLKASALYVPTRWVYRKIKFIIKSYS
jgi:ribosomal protein L23